MIFRQRARRFTAWIACFAILLASLAPSISHAISSAKESSGFFGEICSADGAKSVKLGNSLDSKTSTPVQKSLHFEHCPFCSSHAGAIGLPPSAGFQLPLLSGHSLKPTLFYQSPRPLFVWASAHSRAPPAL
jgi:hypothetical protein